ncbi:MAG TPA: sugar phosphate nucleotidyltransferase, partial [Gemmatimonadales bacterium]|nr:sugar phosphate nucleotidyltransferase [Gemmatimonadales bacterium]
MHWAIILAGGAGTRFWPLSTPTRPKQALPLASDQPLVLDALARLEGLIPRERILLVTGAALAG